MKSFFSFSTNTSQKSTEEIPEITINSSIKIDDNTTATVDAVYSFDTCPYNCPVNEMFPKFDALNNSLNKLQTEVELKTERMRLINRYQELGVEKVYKVVFHTPPQSKVFKDFENNVRSVYYLFDIEITACEGHECAFKKINPKELPKELPKGLPRGTVIGGRKTRRRNRPRKSRRNKRNRRKTKRH